MKVHELIEYLNMFGDDNEIQVLVAGDDTTYNIEQIPEYDEDLDAVVIVLSSSPTK